MAHSRIAITVARLLSFALLSGLCGCSSDEGSENAPNVGTTGTTAEALVTCAEEARVIDVGNRQINPGTVCNASTGVWTVVDKESRGALGDDYAQENEAWDSMTFVGTQKSGDVEIVARITKVDAVDGMGSPTSLANFAQVGVAIRESLAPTAKMVAGLINVGHCTSCPGRGHPADQLSVAVSAGGWQTEEFDDPPILWTGSTFVSSLVTEPPKHATWFRLQRIGQDVAVSRSTDGARWIPLATNSGGPFTASQAHVGFFVAGRGRTTTMEVDTVYIGPPRLGYKTSWIGSSGVPQSVGVVTREITSLYVAPDGSTYKIGHFGDPGRSFQLFRNGQFVKQVLHHAGGLQQSLAGDGTNVYLAGCYPGNDTDCKLHLFDAELNYLASSTSLARPAGIAVDPPYPDGTLGDRVYVSLAGSTGSGTGEIVVFSRATAQEIGRFPFQPPFTGGQPGPLAVDNNRNLWVLQPAVDYPIPGNYDLKRTPRAVCLTVAANGNLTSPCGGGSGRYIDLSGPGSNPSVLTYDSIRNQLLIAQSGFTASPLRGQNIRIYSSIAGGTGNPSAFTNFGQVGGVYAAETGVPSGTVLGSLPRFYTPIGVGVDAAGDIYVASGTNVDIRKFARNGPYPNPAQPLWGVYGLIEGDGGAFDPSTDGQDYYTTKYHFSFNPNVTPATWALKAVTWRPGDSLNEKNPRAGGTPELRRLPDSSGVGRLFMYTFGSWEVYVYRFADERMIPAASLRVLPASAQDPDCPSKPYWRRWVDAGASPNGVEDASEIVKDCQVPVVSQTIADPLTFVGSELSVDAAGTIWATSSYLTNEPGGSSLSFRALNVNNGVPAFQAGQPVDYDPAAGPLLPRPAQFTAITRQLYDSANQVMYVFGQLKDIGDAGDCGGRPSGLWSVSMSGVSDWKRVPGYARYDNFPAAPVCRYVRLAPHPLLTDDIMHRLAPYPTFDGSGIANGIAYDGDSWTKYNATVLAGDKLFMNWGLAPIHVIDGVSGTPLSVLWGGPEVSGSQWHTNSKEIMRAFRRNNGEYLVSSIDVSHMARALVFNWSPTGTLTWFENPTVMQAGDRPRDIVAGGDGNLWFTMAGANKIGKLTPAGKMTAYGPLPPRNGNQPEPTGIVRGPDGNAWFTLFNTDQIGCIAANGTFATANLPGSVSRGPRDITVGPDNNLWFTEYRSNRINRAPATNCAAPSAPNSGWQVGTGSIGPWGIATVGSSLQFTEELSSDSMGRPAGRISTITTSGTITRTLLPTGTRPTGIVALPSPGTGAWFAETPLHKIGKRSGGLITHYAFPFPPPPEINNPRILVNEGSNTWFTADRTVVRMNQSAQVTLTVSTSPEDTPGWITVGPDGNLWFTAENSGRIGRIMR